tara:strand:+ start:6165 stop:7277 length:1113 start_codon:yes stop_codon:yes gene_type:complete
MSRTLVIHVGAQKCASSSLQASLRLVHQALKGRFGFCFLNPAQLRAADLAIAKQGDGAFGYIDQVLSRQAADQVVISHEMLGNRPALVSAIAERALGAFSFDRVVISGYTRLQSNYHVSSFAQWYFRDRKKLLSDIRIFRDLDLPWRKFTAQERSLFVLCLSGKDRNWCANYRRFLSGVSHLSGRVCVVSCHIPTRQLPYSLLQHFVESTGLNLGLDDLSSMDVRKNQSFHPVVIHGVSSFSSDLPANRQSFFPGPHEGNRWLFRVCDRVSDQGDVVSELERLFSPAFERRLLNHLDSRTAADNHAYCELMSVDQRYFQPSSDATMMTGDELKDLAFQTAKTRRLKAIQEFNCTIEDALFSAARKEIVCN